MWVDGLPSQRLVDHHARLAQGGIELTTVAYGAVHPDGRTLVTQMFMRPEVVPGLKADSRLRGGPADSHLRGNDEVRAD